MGWYIPNVRSVQFGLCFIRIFFFLSFFFFFSFSTGIFLDRHLTDSKDSREWNHYVPCFPHSPAHEYSFSSSRFLPLLFNRSICSYQADSWWYLFSLNICILLQSSRSYWPSGFKVTLWRFELISNYHLFLSKRTA